MVGMTPKNYSTSLTTIASQFAMINFLDSSCVSFIVCTRLCEAHAFILSKSLCKFLRTKIENVYSIKKIASLSVNY